jgi:hypothetical protein
LTEIHGLPTSQSPRAEYIARAAGSVGRARSHKCPQWVISRHHTIFGGRSLCPRKQTCSAPLACPLSANRVLTHCSKQHRYSITSVGACEQYRRHIEAERLDRYLVEVCAGGWAVFSPL